MKARQNADTWVIVFERGEDVIEALTSWAHENNIRGAFFHGLGGASAATLGIYKLGVDKQYHFTDFEDDLEITSLNGNIARDGAGEVIVHAHASISGPDLKTYGGHVKRLVVAGTCELFVRTDTGELQRKQDDDIGLKLIQL